MGTSYTLLHGAKDVADDIFIYGEGESKDKAIHDHDQKLSRFLHRCREQVIKLNKNKFSCDKKNGLHWTCSDSQGTEA